MILGFYKQKDPQLCEDGWRVVGVYKDGHDGPVEEEVKAVVEVEYLADLLLASLTGRIQSSWTSFAANKRYAKVS